MKKRKLRRSHQATVVATSTASGTRSRLRVALGFFAIGLVLLVVGIMLFSLAPIWLAYPLGIAIIVIRLVLLRMGRRAERAKSLSEPSSNSRGRG